MHVVGMLRDMPVDKSEQVGKPSLHGVLACAAKPYLVGDEDKCRVYGYETVKFVAEHLKRPVDILVTVEEDIGSPHGHAVDKHRARRQFMVGGVKLLLDIGPFRSAPQLMELDAMTELIVKRLCRGKIDRCGGKVKGGVFRKFTFTRPLTAGNHYDFFRTHIVTCNKYAANLLIIAAKINTPPKLPPLCFSYLHCPASLNYKFMQRLFPSGGTFPATYL